MSRRYATRYRRSHFWDARGETKRAAAEALGIPVRDYADPRESIPMDLSTVGGKRWVIEPRRGYMLQWRVVDEDSGEVLFCGALKSAIHAVADALPRARVMDD